MLNEVTARINARIEREEAIDDFRAFCSEDVSYLDSVLRLESENFYRNGDETMYDESFLLDEDTQNDAELTTFLQSPTDAHDTKQWNQNPDISDSDLTHLQCPTDYSDNYSHAYQSDTEPQSILSKEVNYSDHQTTPVSVDEFSNESFSGMYTEDYLDEDFLMEEDEEDGSDSEAASFLEDCDTLIAECGGTPSDDDNQSEDVFMEEDEEDGSDSEDAGLDEDFSDMYA
jgi:hypothetical protein